VQLGGSRLWLPLLLLLRRALHRRELLLLVFGGHLRRHIPAVVEVVVINLVVVDNWPDYHLAVLIRHRRARIVSLLLREPIHVGCSLIQHSLRCSLVRERVAELRLHESLRLHVGRLLEVVLLRERALLRIRNILLGLALWYLLLIRRLLHLLRRMHGHVQRVLRLRVLLLLFLMCVLL